MTKEREKNFNDFLEMAMFEIQGESGYSLERDREYNGQSHTDSGVRGKTIVSGLTMRDISDCIVRGFLDAAGLGDTVYPIRDDIYRIDLDKIDPGAVINNTMCWVEKYMGIYPNVPKVKKESNEVSDKN